jgi:hypothetical protein
LVGGYYLEKLREATYKDSVLKNQAIVVKLN